MHTARLGFHLRQACLPLAETAEYCQACQCMIARAARIDEVEMVRAQLAGKLAGRHAARMAYALYAEYGSCAHTCSSSAGLQRRTRSV